MKLSSILSALGLMLCTQSLAQDIDFAVIVPDTAAYQDVHVFVAPDQGMNTSVLERTGREFRGQGMYSPSHFYNIYMNDSNRQLSFPVYADSENCEIVLTATQMSTERIATDNVNKALVAYEAYSSDMARRSGDDLLRLPDDDLKASILSLITVADSLAVAYELQGTQADFLRTWGASSAFSLMSTIDFMAKRQQRDLTFGASSLLPPAESLLDTPMAMWFYGTPNIVMSSLAGRTAEERLASLFEKYSTPEIRDKAKVNIAQQFIDSHNYATEFESGRKRLEDMISRYDLPTSLLNIYDARQATIPGTPFPADVTLYDVDGNVVPFSNFLGKYVYVDMWVSWCGPCCAEVPHLQNLESTLGRDDVAFLSISIDSSKAPWLKRMKELNMHGNQVIDTEGRISDKLNIRSIPHFLLYGPDGKLITYKTSRPSHTRTREMLLSLPPAK